MWSCGTIWRTIAVLLALVSLADQRAVSRLENFATDLERDQITISGLSSGADFAVNFQVAYSSSISGSCIFAGQSYHCSSTFHRSCKTGDLRKVKDIMPLVNYAKSEEAKGTIDPLKDLGSARVYLYRGTKDHRYQKNYDIDSVGLVQKFFAFFSKDPDSQLYFEDRVTSTHVWPTEYIGPRCGTAKSQAIEACGYDGAKNCLIHAHGASRMRAPKAKGMNVSHFHEFDQTPYFGEDWPGLADEGVVYVPAVCKQKWAMCGLHVALHGCGVDHYYDLAVRSLGFNEMAEANRMIILYPRMKQNTGNAAGSKRRYKNSFNTRLGCWDSWGDTGSDFALKKGLQMAAVWQMIEALDTKTKTSRRLEVSPKQSKYWHPRSSNTTT